MQKPIIKKSKSQGFVKRLALPAPDPSLTKPEVVR
jgi:hypothetical protein